MLPRNSVKAKVRGTKWAQDNYGNPVGRDNPKPILDSRQYVVEFGEGTEAKLTANSISIPPSMYAQCDPGSNQYLMLDSVVYFRRSTTALFYADQNKFNNLRTYRGRSTAGWQLCCQWKDGSKYWQKLANLKESHLIETSEYAISQHLQVDPAFNW